MAEPPIQLLVGLGNVGRQYEATRHNVGFVFVDALATRHGATFRREARFAGETAEIERAGRRVRMLKPSTLMNLSGRAVQAMAAFYRVAPESVLIVHDDIDLPPGAVRLKRGGGHGGHNGLRDIIAKLGSADFARLRFGVGHPGTRERVIGYVLERPPAAEREAIEAALASVEPVLDEILAGAFEAAMNELHRRTGGETAAG